MLRNDSTKRNQDASVLTYFSFLCIIWIYVGAVRSWILPSLSNYLYFLHIPILGALLFKLARYQRIQMGILSVFGILLAIYQIIQIFLNKIDLIGGFYGYITYTTPLLFIYIYKKTQLSNLDLKRLITLLLATLPVNLIIVFFQVVKKSSFLQTAGFSNETFLGTANGIVRATGTFTSSAGYSFYIIFLVLILYLATNKGFVGASMCIWSASNLIILIMLSGSRTILFFLILNLAILLIIPRNKNNITKGVKLSKFVIVLACLGIYEFFTTSNSPALRSFSQRISDASRSENTSARIISSIVDPFHHLTEWKIFGSGLGSFGHGTIGYGSNLWIENDLTKNMLEGGVFIGSLFILFRFLISISFLILLKKYWKNERTECLMGAATFTPLLISGQVTNQGSLLLGLCISIIIFLRLIEGRNAEKE